MAVKKQAKKKALKASPKKRAKKASRPAAKKAVKKRTAKKAAPRAVKKSVRAASRKPAKTAAAAPAAARMSSAAVAKRKEMLKRLLLKKRNDVVQGLEAQMGRKLTLEAGQKIDSAMDSADQSAQDVDAGIDYSILEMKYEQYKDIADAFRKLQNDTYGVCEECGSDISIKRLEVNPLARYCIECKTRKEELEKIQREETRFKE